VWKLSKLEIRGFKSFADAAQLDFPEGITAVVGPNGCGKSNISDAILWVLGEQSTRALRAQRMQDVIFQGTATRKAIGLAEVTLYLSNGAHGDDGGVDPLAELEAVGKGVSDGNGNGKGRSIAELAAESGAAAGGNGGNGKGSNGNGNGNGARHTAADDEAVDAGEGIAIDTSGEIEIDASDEVDASADGEVEGGELGDEQPGVLKITRRLFRSGDSEYLLDGRKCRLRDIRERLAGTGLGARACFLIGQGKIDQILSASSLERRGPLEEAAGITLYRQRRHLTQLKLEATAQDLARIDDIYQEVGRQMRSLKRQAGRARRYKKLRAEQRRLERAWLHGELWEARHRAKLAAAAMSAAAEAEATARDKLATASERLDAARAGLRASRQAEQERRQRLYQNQLEQERLRAEAQRQEDRGSFARERLTELERRAGELAERFEEARGLQERREEVARQSEAAAETARQVLTEAEEDLEAARRRLDLAMRPASNAPEDDGEPRALSADLVVEKDDFPALSLALGDLLDALVLPDSKLGDWLDESLDGNRRVRALRRPEAGFSSPPPSADGILGPLGERVDGRTETARAVVGALLHDTWLVTDPADAPRLARQHAGHAFVDRSGSCWACGVEVRVRGRQARLAALEDVAAEPTAKKPGADEPAEPEVTSPEELAAREQRDRAATAARAATAQADAARQELAVSQAACRRLQAERERTLAEVKSLREATEAAAKNAAEARRQADEVAKRGVAMEADLEHAGSDDKAAEAEAAGLEAAQAQARDEVEQAHDARGKLEIEAAELRVEGTHIEGQIRERLNMEPDRLLEQGPVEAEADDQAEGKKRKKDDVIDLEALDARQLRAMILEVQAKIDRLGPVNLMAYDDFEEQEERHEELGKQRQDLKGAAANLEEAIRRIDEDCIKRFTECFESINGYFNRIFRQLFGGGKAGMRLEDPEDPLNTGIEIFAQPPGKKLQNIRLLSGGERTLVALSLLFAIFEYRPTAFCILDEADAALDEVNIDRFLRALHQFESRTQFILITHNKRTMEIADLLYGVTMQESGVSQLVSVQLQ
jgi:chromosome segregation protein